MSSWWQKKLLPYGLRYVLSRTGILDEQAQDIANFNISVGKQNVIELRDVGLNIAQLSRYAKLPPCLRIEAARILLLRLTIPADFFQSSIVAEVDGIDLIVRLHDQDVAVAQPSTKGRRASSTFAKVPPHRKTDDRLPSRTPYDPDGFNDSEDDVHIPTTQEVAKSFLMEEPVQERKELEASVAANSKSLEESFVSQSSDGDEIGTGIAVGLPGFLASFLQGLVDKLKVQIKNVNIRLEVNTHDDRLEPLPISFHLRVGSIDVDSVNPVQNDTNDTAETKRDVRVFNVSIDLLSNLAIFAEPPQTPSAKSSSEGRQMSQNSMISHASQHTHNSLRDSVPSASSNVSSRRPTSSPIIEPHFPTVLDASVSTVDADRFADAGEDDNSSVLHGQASELDIRMGDDNISWGSRRSQSNAPADDLWRSMVSDEELPDALLLEQDRAPTPRAFSSRGSSPLDQYSRRATTNASHTYAGPYGDLPDQQGLPGTWTLSEGTRLQREHYHLGQSSSQSQALADDDYPTWSPAKEIDTYPTDNKTAALEHPASKLQAQQAPSQQPGSMDDLAQSQIFDHETARSMYMSAMTTSPEMHVPGGWDLQSQSSTSQLSSPTEVAKARPDTGSAHIQLPEPYHPASGNATPRAHTPLGGDRSASVAQRESRRLFYLDVVSISVPSSRADSPQAQVRTGDAPEMTRSYATNARGLPGTFSAYSERSSLRFKDQESIYAETRGLSDRPEEHLPMPIQDGLVDVTIGTVTAHVDLPIVRLLQRVGTKAMATVRVSDAEKRKVPAGSTQDLSNGASIIVQIQHLQLSFHERVLIANAATTTAPSAAGLIDFTCHEIRYTQSSDITFTAESVDLALSGQELVSLQSNTAEPAIPGRPIVGKPAVSVRIATKFAAGNREVTDVYITTSPIGVVMDLQKIDSTFTPFGGLSGVLELGNSMLSESHASSPMPSPKVSKGVRFAGAVDDKSAPQEVKVNARFDRVSVTLRGPCTCTLRTTTIKAVYRETQTSATVENIALSGPDGNHAERLPISIELAALRFDYFLAPPDKDLERLLSLLTPSKDQYDNDDDILIETLLRQRRKGGLLRIGVRDVHARVDNWDCLSELRLLGDELARLSVVAKYLPEDDRPGLLTLARVGDIEVQLPVNAHFGTLRLSIHNLNLAHVGLPALLAFSLETILARRPGASDLIHPLVPPSGTESLPMLMGRMLGGELEPTMKIKLFNVCVEYSVTILVALTGSTEDTPPDELIMDVARSVANLTMTDPASRPASKSPVDPDAPELQKTAISILVHDSAIGLNPERIPSKALFVLADVHAAVAVPPGDTMTAKLDLRRAEIFVTDNAVTSLIDIPPSKQPLVNVGSSSGGLFDLLGDHGFVPVCSVRSATICLRAEEDPAQSSSSIEVTIRNELLLLETCADSTQTLIATLAALAPPAKPDKQPKYLTEPMTIEDMMASFTGDAFERPELEPETLFDVDEERDDDSDILFDARTGDQETDDLLAESEMTSSLYGPVSGVFGREDDGEDDADENFQETAESLLEDDPFEMTISPTDMPMSDQALLRDLQKQCLPSSRGEAVDLGIWQVRDLGYDTLGCGQQGIGTQQRLSGALTGKGDNHAVGQTSKLPFTLKLRELNVIWHLYDGYDWERTRQGIVDVVEQVERRAEERKARRRQSHNDREDEESVIGDILFNSIYIGVPAEHDVQDLRRRINLNIDDQVSETESVPLSGISRPTNFSANTQALRQHSRKRLRLGRSRAHKISLEMKGVSADVLVYPPHTGDVLNCVDVRVKDFEIFDNVPQSTWRKFLTHQGSGPADREMSKPMFHIHMQNVKTLESHSASEITLEVSVLPLRLHVDQDALDFITRFFEFKDRDAMPDTPGEQPFLQRLEVHTVNLCLDYKPKRLDYVGLRSGRTTEFMNLIGLDAANIRLQHAIVYGLRGFDALHPTLNDIWMPDVRRNQLPTVLAGLAPVRSLVNITSGIRDVVAIPVREYKKDGRIVRSIQKGAFQFGKTTASELARFGAKVALGTQTALANAEGFLSPAAASPSTRPHGVRRISSEQGWHDVATDDDSDAGPRAVSAYANQPLGVLSGLRSARRQLEHDLLTAKDALIAVQGELLESRDPASAAAAVVKHAPTVILRPVIGATRAVGTTLLGVGNQIDRSNMRRVDDKYKHR